MKGHDKLVYSDKAEDENEHNTPANSAKAQKKAVTPGNDIKLEHWYSHGAKSILCRKCDAPIVFTKDT